MLSMKLIKMLILLSIFMSFMMMMFSNHPLMMGCLVIIQAIFMSTFITQTFFITWFSFLIFMIYLGGILMIFSYVISLTYSKEPLMSLKKKKMTIPFILMCFFLPFSIESNNEFNKKEISILLTSSFSKSLKMSIFLMIFLLMIMIMVVFLTESDKSYMRSI